MLSDSSINSKMQHNSKPKATYGKHKTYGKAVRTHITGFFGRGLWSEIETIDHAVERAPTTNAERTAHFDHGELKERSSPKPTVDETVITVLDASVESLMGGIKTLDLSSTASEVSPGSSPGTRATPARKPDLNSAAYSPMQTSDKENDDGSTRRQRKTPKKKLIESNSLPPSTGRASFRHPLGDKLTPESECTKKNGRRKASLAAVDATDSSPSRRKGKTKSYLAATIPDSEIFENPVVGSENKLVADIVLQNESIIIDLTNGDSDEEMNPNNKSAVVNLTLIDSEGEGNQSIRPESLGNEVANDASNTAEEQPFVITEGSVEVIDETSTNNHGERCSKDLEETTDNQKIISAQTTVTFREGEEKKRCRTTTDQLLQLCDKQDVVDFEAHIQRLLETSTIRKLGEASYSEVFLVTPPNAFSTTVLKVIPFGKEGQCEAKSILQEVRITKSMAETGIRGFIGFRGSYVVKGRFPESLMELWDAYDEEIGSESDRPDFYDSDQLFSIIMLENGGRDLEHFELHSWEEARDIFWRVTFTLAEGERKCEFEHRDLHFGNIVIRRVPYETDGDDKESPTNPFEKLSLNASGSEETASRLKVALIDYTLSRALCGDEIEFASLDDEALFTGKGNYQFDIYRFMRNHLSSGLVDPSEEWIDWNTYAPKTNVFWLHYLTNILLTKKGLSKPAARGRYAASKEEKIAYKSLEAVSKIIDPRKRRFDKSISIECASDLVAWIKKEGWLDQIGLFSGTGQ